jgi:hypothetical protein
MQFMRGYAKANGFARATSVAKVLTSVGFFETSQLPPEVIATTLQ